MPELPEVETVVRDLRPLLENCKISSVRKSSKRLRRPWRKKWSEQLVGQRILEIRRRGKWIIVVFENDFHFVIHLGMTGQLRIVPAKERQLPHTHFVIGLDRDVRQLRFRDVRRFGSATLFSSAPALDEFFEQSELGPEPFSLDLEYFRKKLANTSRCLKAILLDQKVVAGVGNIYADEALFEARLHPQRLGQDITRVEARRLCTAVKSVLHRAVEFRGSSIRDYVDGAGKRGRYQDEFAVYGKTNKPCNRCRTKIERIRLAGRSTHFCPKCQGDND